MQAKKVKFLFKRIYKQSILFDVSEKILEFTRKIIYSSFFYKIFFHDIGGNNFFLKSFCYSILNFLMKIILFPKRFIYFIFDNSFTKQFLDKIFEPYVPKVLLSSSLFKFLSDFFGIKLKRSDNKSNLIFISSLLIIFIALSFFIGIKKAFLSVAGFFFVLLVLHNTKIGLFALAFLIPIIKTKFILAIVLLTIFSFVLKLLLTNDFSISFNLIDLFIIFFGTLIFYSVFISYIPMDSFKMAAVYLLFIAFYFVAKNAINNKDNLFTIVSLMILSSAAVALIGILQKYFGLAIDTQMWIDEQMFENNTIRVYSTLDNPNVLGEYLLFMIPITFGSIYYFKNKLCKFVSFAILCLLCACMLLTLSRGAWLGLIAAIIIFVVLRDKKFLWLGLVLFLFLPMLIPQSFIERFMSIGNMADTSTSYRVGIWIGSLRMIKDFWPIGIGLGTQVFILIFQKYALSASYALHSHNFYLQILIDLGIAGALTMLMIIYLFYKNLFLNNKFLRDDFVKTFKISLCAGFSGYLIQGLADNIWYNYRIVLLFWFMIAISTACFNLSKLGVWEKFKYFQHTTKFN